MQINDSFITLLIPCSLDNKVEVNLPMSGEYSPSFRKYVVDPKRLHCVDFDAAEIASNMTGPLAQLVRASC